MGQGHENAGQQEGWIRRRLLLWRHGAKLDRGQARIVGRRSRLDKRRKAGRLLEFWRGRDEVKVGWNVGGQEQVNIGKDFLLSMSEKCGEVGLQIVRATCGRLEKIASKREDLGDGVESHVPDGKDQTVRYDIGQLEVSSGTCEGQSGDSSVHGRLRVHEWVQWGGIEEADGIDDSLGIG